MLIVTLFQNYKLSRNNVFNHGKATYLETIQFSQRLIVDKAPGLNICCQKENCVLNYPEKLVELNC